jgi:RNA polymerase-binding transcription factor DksA
MEKEKIEYFKLRLEKEKKDLEAQLGGIANPNQEQRDEWKAKYPSSESDSGHENLETKADESDQYGARIALTENLTRQLANVDLALEKIQKGFYGKCENCDQEISIERLEVLPTARFCFGCDGKI